MVRRKGTKVRIGLYVHYVCGFHGSAWGDIRRYREVLAKSREWGEEN